MSAGSNNTRFFLMEKKTTPVQSPQTLCVTCGLLIPEAEYQNHLFTSHPTTFCNKCGQFVPKHEYQNHQSIVHSSALCMQCGDFIPMDVFEDHLSNLHSINQPPKTLCDVCGAMVKTTELERHAESGSHDVCVTDQTNLKSQNVSQISTKAPNIKYYMCTICLRMFEQEYALFEHLTVVHKAIITWYTCSLCQVSYKSRDAYHDHIINVHKLVPPSQKSPSSTDQVVSMEEISTETKDQKRRQGCQIQDPLGLDIKVVFKCSSCINSFVDLVSLNNHMNEVHHMEVIVKCICLKYQTCDVCRYTDLGKEVLNSHSTCVKNKANTEPSVSTCEFCGGFYKCHTSYVRHMKRWHAREFFSLRLYCMELVVQNAENLVMCSCQCGQYFLTVKGYKHHVRTNYESIKGSLFSLVLDEDSSQQMGDHVLAKMIVTRPQRKYGIPEVLKEVTSERCIQGRAGTSGQRTKIITLGGQLRNKASSCIQSMGTPQNAKICSIRAMSGISTDAVTKAPSEQRSNDRKKNKLQVSESSSNMLSVTNNTECHDQGNQAKLGSISNQHQMDQSNTIAMLDIFGSKDATAFSMFWSKGSQTGDSDSASGEKYDLILTQTTDCKKSMSDNTTQTKEEKNTNCEIKSYPEIEKATVSNKDGKTTGNRNQQYNTIRQLLAAPNPAGSSIFSSIRSSDKLELRQSNQVNPKKLTFPRNTKEEQRHDMQNLVAVEMEDDHQYGTDDCEISQNVKTTASFGNIKKGNEPVTTIEESESQNMCEFDGTTLKKCKGTGIRIEVFGKGFSYITCDLCGQIFESETVFEKHYKESLPHRIVRTLYLDKTNSVVEVKDHGSKKNGDTNPAFETSVTICSCGSMTSTKDCVNIHSTFKEMWKVHCECGSQTDGDVLSRPDLSRHRVTAIVKNDNVNTQRDDKSVSVCESDIEETMVTLTNVFTKFPLIRNEGATITSASRQGDRATVGPVTTSVNCNFLRNSSVVHLCVLCHDVFLLKQDLVKHLKSHPAYICECKVTFTKLELFTNHVKVFHKESNLEGCIQKVDLMMQPSGQKKRNSLEERIFVDKLSLTKTIDLLGASKITRRVKLSPPLWYGCGCGLRYTSEKLYHNHLYQVIKSGEQQDGHNLESTIKWYHCTACPVVFGSIDGYMLHKRTAHRPTDAGPLKVMKVSDISDLLKYSCKKLDDTSEERMLINRGLQIQHGNAVTHYDDTGKPQGSSRVPCSGVATATVVREGSADTGSSIVEKHITVPQHFASQRALPSVEGTPLSNMTSPVPKDPETHHQQALPVGTLAETLSSDIKLDTEVSNDETETNLKDNRLSTFQDKEVPEMETDDSKIDIKLDPQIYLDRDGDDVVEDNGTVGFTEFVNRISLKRELTESLESIMPEHAEGLKVHTLGSNTGSIMSMDIGEVGRSGEKILRDTTHISSAPVAIIPPSSKNAVSSIDVQDKNIYHAEDEMKQSGFDSTESFDDTKGTVLASEVSVKKEPNSCSPVAFYESLQTLEEPPLKQIVKDEDDDRSLQDSCADSDRYGALARKKRSAAIDPADIMTEMDNNLKDQDNGSPRKKSRSAVGMHISKQDNVSKGTTETVHLEMKENSEISISDMNATSGADTPDNPPTLLMNHPISYSSNLTTGHSAESQQDDNGADTNAERTITDNRQNIADDVAITRPTPTDNVENIRNDQDDGVESRQKAADDVAEIGQEQADNILDISQKPADDDAAVSLEPCNDEDVSTSESSVSNTVSIQQHSEVLAESINKDASASVKWLCKCGICGEQFETFEAIVSHAKIHDEPLEHAGGQRQYPCEECGKIFHRRTVKEDHIRYAHVKKPRSCCYLCKKTFASLKGLQGHLKTHDYKRPFVCGKCDRTFVKSCQLKIHLLSHTGDKPFLCTICGYACTSSSALFQHERRHYGEKKRKCLTCHKHFSIVHNSNMPYLWDKSYKCKSCSSPEDSSHENSFRNYLRLPLLK